MKWRWIAAIVCALFVSAGTVFAALHDHSEEASHSHQDCAACVWHHESVEVPEVTLKVRAPDGFVVSAEAPLVFFSKVSLGIHPSRGPPSFLL